MKICITTMGPNLDAPIDPRFGRCQFFLMVDSESLKFEAIPNQGMGAMRGAGIAAAQIVASSGAKAVITGNVGPNAFMVLNQSGIKVFAGVLGVTAKQALEAFKNGQIPETPGPTAPGIGPGGGFGGGRGPGGGRGRGGRGW